MKNFCPLPWLHTYLGSDFKRSLCCISNINLGENIKLIDVWNNNIYKNIRLDF